MVTTLKEFVEKALIATLDDFGRDRGVDRRGASRDFCKNVGTH